ncbi:9443_t:CDS:1, partial [Cetraspora pellucida]
MTLYNNKIQSAKQKFLNKHKNELNIIQDSINQLSFTSPMSAQ